MIKKPNLVLTVVLIVIIEGVAIYLNIMAHPQSQPGLTIFIVLLMALIFGLFMKYRFNKQTENNKTGSTKPNKESLRYGIGFWIAAGIYCLINIFMNLKQIAQSKILIYNYIITGVAVLGLISNIIFLKKNKE